MIPTIVTNTMIPAAKELNERFGRIGNRLERAGRLDYTNGTAEINEAEVRGAFIDGLGPNEGEAWAREFAALAHDGFAVLQQPERRGNIPGAIFPWRLLAGPLRPETLSAELLAEFGIGPGGTPLTARKVMTERFPRVPASVLDGQNLERLNQIALFSLLENPAALMPAILRDLDEALTITVKPGGGAIYPPGSGTSAVDIVNEALACIKNATIKLHWWGPEICFDNKCGNLIADAILAGSGAKIATAFAQLSLTNATLAVVVKALGGTVSAVLTLLGFYTAIMIKANITSLGVCLQALWPVTGGFVWWAAGIT